MSQTKPPKITTPLLRWFDAHKRGLPWRNKKTPYRVWVSEVMLQQTTVKAVIPYFQQWFRRFPTIRALAQAKEQQVLSQWQGLGYYARAKNLYRAAKIITQNYRGKIPQDKDILSKLPGFGPYTTGAVLSIGFQKPEVIVDANIRRVVRRYLGKEKGGADVDKSIVKFLQGAIDRKRPGDFNEALMDLGATVCVSRIPQCYVCPLKKGCSAFKKGLQDIIPGIQKSTLIGQNVVIGLFRKGKKIYLQKRPSAGLLADFWELPGGKLKTGEEQIQGLKRELKEELGVSIDRADFLGQFRQYYTKYKVNLFVYLCQTRTDLPVDDVHKWLTFRQIEKFPLPSGTSRIIEHLKKSP